MRSNFGGTKKVPHAEPVEARNALIQVSLSDASVQMRLPWLVTSIPMRLENFP
jgi:hypothetical protein